METKQIISEEELIKYWKQCFIPGLPKMKKTKKNLLEGFNVGCKVMRTLPQRKSRR